MTLKFRTKSACYPQPLIYIPGSTANLNTTRDRNPNNGVAAVQTPHRFTNHQNGLYEEVSTCGFTEAK